MDNTDRYVEVSVTVTLRKLFCIPVNDYVIKSSGIDEDNHYWEDVDFNNCNLEKSFRSTHSLPNEVYDKIKDLKHNIRKKTQLNAINDLSDWVEEDLEITIED